MTGSTRSADLWPLPESSGAIESSRAVLEEIRQSAVNGFNSFGHGGLEIGGILYGAREGGITRILGCAEIACDHARGPGFVLSAADEQALAGQLASRIPEQMIPVGWYCSHTRSGMALTAANRELFDRFFPQPWQIGLVVCPERFGPARIAIVLREADGRLPEIPGREFTLEPLRETAPSSTDAPAPMESDPRPAVLDSPPVRNLRPWRKAAAMAVAGMLVAFVLAWIASSHTAPPRLGLRTYELAGQTRIEWDRDAPAVTKASHGWLEIDDGGAKTTLVLDAVQLRASSVTYVQHSGDVVVRLHVDRAASGPKPQDEFARLLIAPPAPRGSAEAAAPPGAVGARPTAPAPRGGQQAERTLTDAAAPGAVRRPATIPTPKSAPPPDANLPPPPLVAYAPPAQPSLTLLKALPVPQIYQGPRSGRLVWTGDLARRGVIEIDQGKANMGVLRGALPGQPVEIRVHPAEFGPSGLVAYTADSAARRQEPPAQNNGWNATRFDWDPERARDLSILEAPNPSNEYKRLVLRSDTRGYSVILVEWTLRRAE